ncbi:MAG TPA: outer membrane beta-barrel protein, partial [Burkholderiales bacterium]|nr:outer membrane beta-barrel protein [Burkholderiales bacterium]
ALAQAQGVYVGGSIGQAQVDGFCDSEPGFTVTSCDDKDTGWKLFLGYRVNRNFAVEASYMNAGEFGGTVSTIFGTASVKADATAWGAAALGIFPVSEQFELFGKLGFVRGESDADVVLGGTRVTVGDSGTELAYGLGAVYNINRHFGIRAEWENINDADISLLSIGIQYKFQ